MAIEQFTSEEIAKMQVGCPTLSKFPLGSVMNMIIEAVNNGTPCNYVLIEADKEALNTMCPFNGVKMGDLIEAIIAATATSVSLQDLTSLQKKALNNTCGTLAGLSLGNKLQEIIDALNNAEPVVHLIEVILPSETTLPVEQSSAISITWNPDDTADKTYTVRSSDPEGLAVEVTDEKSFSIEGLKEGEYIAELIPNDGGEEKKASCAVSVTSK